LRLWNGGGPLLTLALRFRITIMNQDRKQAACDAFDRGSNSADAWQQSAEGLVGAALILRENRPQPKDVLEMRPSETRAFTHRLWPELMLWGMSIEDFLKCLILKRGGTLARNGRFIGLRNHDLSNLAIEAEFAMDAEQDRILKVLSPVVKWAGRYPAATEVSKTGGWRLWIVPVDDQIVDLIIAKLRQSVGDQKPNSAST
jgi:hypothetical protein